MEGLYLSGKNDDLLDDPGSLFFQELLNDAVADSTCSNDSEFGMISGHEPTLSHCGRGLGSNRELSSLLLLFFSSALLQIRVLGRPSISATSPRLRKFLVGQFYGLRSKASPAVPRNKL